MQAQWAEFIELKKIIDSLGEEAGHNLSILDIGIGDARILRNIVPIREIWEKIERYEGVDVAQNCIEISRKAISSLGIKNKASVQLLDAVNIQELKKKYDLIICTWFTAGNFYPSHIDIGASGTDLSKNDKFTTIFQQAYDSLHENGEIIIGSMYIDNDSTRKKQEDSYENFGWKVVTNKNDSYVASDNGWWSQRFTEQVVYDYLPFIEKDNIGFIPLDSYDYAMMARIKK